MPADMMIEDCLNRAATQFDADLAAEVREWHQNIRSNYAGADGSAPTEPFLGMRNREITAATTAQ